MVVTGTNRFYTGILLRVGILLSILLLSTCTTFHHPGLLVPLTAEQDSAIPSIALEAAGHSRLVHVRTYGNSGDPIILILHGSLSDSRSMLPLAALADDGYRVVFWDQRGNGLSERITAAEYTLESIIEEIDAVADYFAPGQPVRLIGHSFGAMYTALYLSERPQRVAQAVMIEPAALNGEIFDQTFNDIISINLFNPKMNSLFWQSEQISPMNHEAVDYRARMILLNGTQTNYHVDPDNPPAWPVWRSGGWAEIYRSSLLGSNALGQGFSYDFAHGAEDYPNPVLFVGSSSSALGADYQSRWHLPLFPNGASVALIPNSGHRLIQEDSSSLLFAVRDYLE
ncbi:alpha/beta hydrolase [Spirochaeta dissipatitropha]